jgi:hypothetical protein
MLLLLEPVDLRLEREADDDRLVGRRLLVEILRVEVGRRVVVAARTLLLLDLRVGEALEGLDVREGLLELDLLDGAALVALFTDDLPVLEVLPDLGDDRLAGVALFVVVRC